MKYTCPCCGYKTLDEFPGSYEICKICFWEDDPVQLLDPTYEGGANDISLIESQKNFLGISVSEARFKNNVQVVRKGDQLDPEWRIFDNGDLKNIRRPAELTDKEYKSLDTWYYWKRNPSE